MVSRRQFLSGGLAVAAATTFGQFFRIATAQPKNNAKKLVIVFNYGGWDPTIVLDAKEPSAVVDVAKGKIKQFEKLSIWADGSRPEVDKFFARWGSQAAIINGIAVRSLVHEECVEQILTGVSLVDKPDIGAVVASKIGAERPVPYLTLGAQAHTRELAPLAAEFGFTNQLPSLVVPRFYYPPAGSAKGVTPLQLTDKEKDSVSSYLSTSQRRFAEQHGMSGRNGTRINDYSASTRRADRLAHFLQHSSLAEPKIVFRLADKIPMVLQALQENLSQVAFLQTDGWDTHSNVMQQEGMFNELFGGLNLLMDGLHRGRLIDDTLVLVLSEMGRTPKRNQDQGKDHWPFTSAMLLGGGVNGGRRYGETDAELKPLRINLRTGKADANGRPLHAVHVLSAVLQLMGVKAETHFGNVGILDALVG